MGNVSQLALPRHILIRPLICAWTAQLNVANVLDQGLMSVKVVILRLTMSYRSHLLVYALLVTSQVKIYSVQVFSSLIF